MMIKTETSSNEKELNHQKKVRTDGFLANFPPLPKDDAPANELDADWNDDDAWSSLIDGGALCLSMSGLCSCC